jgi:hypothetical protein
MFNRINEKREREGFFLFLFLIAPEREIKIYSSSKIEVAEFYSLSLFHPLKAETNKFCSEIRGRRGAPHQRRG